ncbi:MAG: polymer-forming cytoskeletal protein [Moraxellaceae bacterium]|nr:polymer-forming cytoskeletal protein [Moraxellaceae bacterium]
MFNKPSVLPRNTGPVGERLGRNGTSSGTGTGNGSATGGTTPASAPLSPSVAVTEQPTPVRATAQTPRETAPVTQPVEGSQLIVGPDVKLRGAEILDCDTLVVDGRVEATMDSRVIRINEHGAFSGKVGIDIAEIWGSFEGELTARDQLIIHATGRVNGKVRYGRLLVESGGVIAGDIEALGEARTDAAGGNRASKPASSGNASNDEHAGKPLLVTLGT